MFAHVCSAEAFLPPPTPSCARESFTQLPPPRPPCHPLKGMRSAASPLHHPPPHTPWSAASGPSPGLAVLARNSLSLDTPEQLPPAFTKPPPLHWLPHAFLPAPPSHLLQPVLPILLCVTISGPLVVSVTFPLQLLICQCLC